MSKVYKLHKNNLISAWDYNVDTNNVWKANCLISVRFNFDNNIIHESTRGEDVLGHFFINNYKLVLVSVFQNSVKPLPGSYNWNIHHYIKIPMLIMLWKKKDIPSLWVKIRNTVEIFI